jgi:hypothetical protein
LNKKVFLEDRSKNTFLFGFKQAEKV